MKTLKNRFNWLNCFYIEKEIIKTETVGAVVNPDNHAMKVLGYILNVNNYNKVSCMTNQSVMAAILKKCALEAGQKTSNINDITHSRKPMFITNTTASVRDS